jgi:hypothetical protein
MFREDGPATTTPLDSPTAADIKAHYAEAPIVHRPWPPMDVEAESGAVVHGPLYFEDPFIDKGSGRTDQTDPNNVYRYGWEDVVAVPYVYSRYTLDWLALPVSMIVTPPWTPMESDGEISKQALGYDHDAAPVGSTPRSEQPAEPAPPPAPGAAETRP